MRRKSVFRLSEVIVEAITVRFVSSYLNLVRELLSALCSAAGENLAAVSVSHSLAEAVFHLAMTLLGLVSSFHFSNLRFTFRFFRHLRGAENRLSGITKQG